MRNLLRRTDLTLQDRQLAKKRIFLAKKSWLESSLQSRQTYSGRQLGRPSRQLLLERTTNGRHMVVTDNFGCRTVVVLTTLGVVTWSSRTTFAVVTWSSLTTFAVVTWSSVTTFEVVTWS